MNAPLGERLKNARWGEFKVGDLFEILSYKKRFDANKVHLVKKGHPYVVRTSLNNGMKGFLNEDKKYLNDGNTISFGQDTATMFYQEKPYFTGDKIKILKPKNERFNKINSMFFITEMTKAFSNFSWGSSSFSIDVISKQIISLPITSSGEIDFDFMESFIRELEEERIRELAAYLKVSGLDNYKLSKCESKALAHFEELEWKEFKIGDLYYKVELAKKKFNKHTDTSNEFSKEFSLPIVNAKHGDNGVMFYGKPEIFDSEEMSIDIVQNGAVATGDVYPQPQKTGILWDAYLIKAKNHIETKNTLFFLSCTIWKSIKPKFFYEFKATWERVQNENIMLPVTKTGEIDFDFMETFISAVQKLVIKDVVLYADKKIAAAKEAVK